MSDEPLMTLTDLASKQPLFASSTGSWKLIVHTSPDDDLMQLFYAHRPDFEYFQQDQGSAVYNCDHIVSAIKLTPRTALVVGAYDVGLHQPLALDTVVPPEPLRETYRRWAAKGTPAIRYALTRNPALAALEQRVVVDVPPRGMKLNDLDRPVVGLRPAGSVGPCPDYDAMYVSLAMLLQAFEHPDANGEWRERLSAVGGVYLLTDRLNNMLYVGKTDAKEGFWSRWHAYAKMRTGNKLVDPAFAGGALQLKETYMSILQVIPRGSATESVIERVEHLWMDRLRTRENGYNSSTKKSL